MADRLLPVALLAGLHRFYGESNRGSSIADTALIMVLFPSTQYGSALTGSLRLFAALRHFFGVYFDARTPVLPEHIIAGTGCSSILDALAAVLADPGDGILCARPHYNGFQPDFAYRNDVHVVGVDLPSGKEADPSSLEAFERQLAQCEQAGQKISAVLLCNPNNPLGKTWRSGPRHGYSDH